MQLSYKIKIIHSWDTNIVIVYTNIDWPKFDGAGFFFLVMFSIVGKRIVLHEV